MRACWTEEVNNVIVEKTSQLNIFLSISGDFVCHIGKPGCIGNRCQ